MDVVVECLGLTENGVDTIIQNILQNFFKLDIKSPEYKAKFEYVRNQIQNLKFKSSKKIPMLLTVSVLLGFDGMFDQKSVTGLTLNQLELLIMRAIEKDVMKEQDIQVDMPMAADVKVPTKIQRKKYLSMFICVLFKLGKIAFNDLISKTTHLVFNADVLLKTLGQRELELALKVGIVGKMRAPGIFRTPKVSIEFLHKSIQEALAALYIVCSKSNAFTTLCGYCCTLDKVMEMSKRFLLYMAGISPAIGCKFSKHILSVASNNRFYC